MDGNGRWAQKRKLPRNAGHKAGVNATRAVIETCAELGVKALTVFAFSSENWRRPATEVTLLMELFVSTLNKEVNKLDENDVCLRFIGERSAFSAKLQKKIQKAELQTSNNKRLNLNIAANYGGRWDIAEASRAIAEQVQLGRLALSEITAEKLAEYFCLSDLPEPDLFIRTGGEQRISNFLLWQLAYTELYFTDCLWPDFDRAEFEKALEAYSNRQRRFGYTGEQVQLGLKNA